ncbi:MAG: hypothetical protein ACE5GC_03405 [Acidimicrobiia bacterium]
MLADASVTSSSDTGGSAAPAAGSDAGEETQIGAGKTSREPDTAPEFADQGADQVDLDHRPIRWWIPVGIALVVLAVYGIVFASLLSRTGDEIVTAPITTTTAAIATTRPTTTTTTTTIPPTTTTTIPPVTTTTLAPIPVSGDPIAVSDLSLAASELGPIAFGDGAADAAGVLAASLGQPDTYFSVGENMGLCPTDEGRALVWGPFTAIFRNSSGTEVLAGYRLAAPEQGSAPHPTEGMRSLSGIGLGDTTSAIEAAYQRSIVAFQEIDGESGFLVLRSTDERTLLWGLLSSDEPATVELIASPRPCDGGPFPTQ